MNTQANTPQLFDVEMEQALIGACLADEVIARDADGLVEPSDFMDPLHGRIWDAIAALRARHGHANPMTLAAHLASDAGMIEVGGRAYLISLVRASSPSPNFKDYARIIRDLAQRRRLHAELEAGCSRIYDFDVPVTQCVAGVLEASGIAAENESREAGYLPLPDAIDEVMREAEAAVNGIVPESVKTGLKDLDALTGGLQSGDMVVIAGRPGQGKAQPLDAPILMQDGSWKRIGALQLGDELASIDGARSLVSGIFERGQREVYRVSFADGRETEACAEHLWSVRYRDWDAPRILSTAQLAKLLHSKRYCRRLSIDLISGYFGSDRKLSLDPYVLGVLLGDGCFRPSQRVRLSSTDADIVARIQDIVGPKIELRKAVGDNCDYHLSMRRGSFAGVPPKDRVNSLVAELRNFGLSGLGSDQKFVPLGYLGANREARLELLRGLLDTDGTAGKTGEMSFCSTSERLADDVQYLVRSLGGVCSISARQKHFLHKGERRAGKLAYVCNIRHPHGEELFKLARKAARAKRGRNASVRLSITSVAPSRMAQTRCISVTHPSSLYVTSDFVVTHNTVLLAAIGRAAAEDGRPAIIFELEMRRRSILHRLFCDIDFNSGHKKPLAYTRMRSGHFHGGEFERMETASGILRNLPISIFDTAGMTIRQIGSHAQRFADRSKRMGVIVIDYLQIVTSGDRYSGSKVAEMTEVSNEIKRMAKRIGWPIAAGCQLNREVEKREVPRPQLSDLRETGAIEQDADIVIGMHRPAYYVQRKKPQKGKEDPAWVAWLADIETTRNVLELGVIKNRSGPDGEVKCFVDIGASAIRDSGWRCGEDPGQGLLPV